MGQLLRSGKPLFFRLAEFTGEDLPAPPNRLGDAVRTHVRSLDGMQKEALIVSARTGACWRLASDEGPYLDGDDEAPCPLSFLTTGMICSYMNEITHMAARRGVEIRDLRLIQDNYYSMRGSALRGTMTGGARDVELKVQIDSSAPSDSVRSMLYDAIAASPLHGLLRSPVESLFSLQHNDHAVDCARVRPLPATGPKLVDDSVFESAAPAAGEWNGLIVRNGMTPKTAETTGFAGSSLAEQQDRILHVRGICTLGPDGIKQVEQLLFNPHGSIFHFLCDESPERGGTGAAPDAATYISAGIAFCFMTQLGRYAKITGRELRDYRIVQDTHFSPGGASGGTGQAGVADPVETNVSIESNESDTYAATALDMSEQTCFLHALCRTPLKTKLRIERFSRPAR